MLKNTPTHCAHLYLIYGVQLKKCATVSTVKSSYEGQIYRLIDPLSKDINILADRMTAPTIYLNRSYHDKNVNVNFEQTYLFKLVSPLYG